MVPTFTLNRSTGEAPNYAPAASPRATPQAFTVASRSATSTDQGVLCTLVQIRTATQPISVRFGAGGSLLRGVHTLVHCRYTFPSCLPNPGSSDSADPPRLCQGCLPPYPFVPGVGLPSASLGSLRRTEAVSFHHATVQGASWRSISQLQIVIRPRGDELGFLVRGVGGLAAAFTHLVVLVQDPVHGGDRCEVGPLVEQFGVDGGRCLVDELVGLEESP